VNLYSSVSIVSRLRMAEWLTFLDRGN